MENIILYHGSENIIEKPIYGYGNRHNDYGLGFYCTEEESLAKEWAVSFERDGFANKYSININGLSILDLTAEDKNILNWLAILVRNRTFSIQSDFGYEALDYLVKEFGIPYEKYDILKGYRADDSYFSFAQDFLNNTISLETLSKAMHLGNLGEQYCLRSSEAFQRLVFQKTLKCEYREWYPRKEARDQKARRAYFKERKKPWKRGSIYMMQILDRELKADDLFL